MLIGRDAECEQIRAALAAARGGMSTVLVLTGEPGVGKTALLGFARETAGDALILGTVGAEPESDIAYANLADIFRPVVDEIAKLHSRQAQALSGALALGPAQAGDRFGVAAATLSLLGVLASSRTVLLTVDDAQWVDTFSLEALAFAANRLHAEGITMLIGTREGAAAGSAFGRHTRLQVKGLDDSSAREVIRTTCPQLSPPVTARLIAEAGGNPLALRELPTLLQPDELVAWSRGLEPLPIASVLQEAFSDQVGDLPAETQYVLLLIAVLGAVPFDVVERAMTAARLRAEAVEPAERAGLVVEKDGRFEFCHPVMRAAVYQRASQRSRRQAHLLAAAALVDSSLPNALERRSWHLVAAGGGADEGVARTLESAATEELARSNYAVATKLMERSADLTTLETQLAPRLLRAADGARLAGAIDDAQRLLRRALSVSVDPETTVAVEYYLARIEMWRGSVAAGRDKLLDLAALVEGDNAEVAVRMLSDASLASIENGDFSLAAETSARAVGLAPSPPDTPLGTAAVRALALALVGEVGPARELLRAHASGFDAIHTLGPLRSSLPRSSTNDQLSLVAALAHLAIEEGDRAGVLLEHAVVQAREHDAIGVLPFRLGRLAWVQIWRGRWPAARASAAEAIVLADDTGWVAERPSSLAAMARLDAAMGLAEDCRRHAGEAEEAAVSRGARPYAAHARAALGLLALSLGDDASAVEELEAVEEFAEETGLVDTPLLWWSGDLIEAYVRRQRMADAARVLARLEACETSSDRPVVAAVIARSRSHLDPDNSERHLGEAIRLHELCEMPFEQARTQLLLGSRLRRRQLRGEAQRYLSSALTRFERLGATPWAERARIELAAAGVDLGERPVGLSALTPQEFQVAQNVARGMSNREIAAAMFLSVKTVEFHLGNVFHKLGVHRRSRLALLITQADPGGSDVMTDKAGSLPSH